MTAPHADQLIDQYVTRLEAALSSVAPARRSELVADVRKHIAEARSELAGETDADVLNILDRLGDPAEMAAAEMERTEPAAPGRKESRVLEIASIVLLLLFWPVGVILLWLSKTWTTRDKLIGTLVPPGGYLGALLLGAVLAYGAFSPMCRTITDSAGHVLSSSCPSDAAQTSFNVIAVLLALFYLVGPIFTTAYLVARLKKREAYPATPLGAASIIGA